MNFALAATTFAVIIPAELPDKTFIAAVVMSARNRPLPVWIGAAAGLIVQALVGVVAGRLLALLPHRSVEGIVAALFLLGGGYLLLTRERAVVRAGEGLAEAVGAAASARVALRAFGLIAFAEFGDLTQVVIANLTARSGDPLSVLVGAALAFVLLSAVAVLAGRTLVRHVSLALVRRISGVVLVGLGVWSLVGALG